MPFLFIDYLNKLFEVLLFFIENEMTGLETPIGRLGSVSFIGKTLLPVLTNRCDG